MQILFLRVTTYLQNQSFTKIGENEDIDIQDIKKLFHVVENEKKIFK